MISIIGLRADLTSQAIVMTQSRTDRTRLSTKGNTSDIGKSFAV